MAMFTCADCKKEFFATSTYHGMKLRCPECGSTNTDEVMVVAERVCKECGLLCSNNEAVCPACGGVVVAKTDVGVSEYEKQEEKDAIKADSFWENFFWGLILPYSLPLLVISIFAALGIGIKSKRRAASGLLCGAAVASTILVTIIIWSVLPEWSK